MNREPQSIYKLSLSVCLFVSKKRQNAWTDQAQILCGKVYGQSDFKYVILKYFYLKLNNLVKFWKWAKNYYEYKELMLTDKATIKS